MEESSNEDLSTDLPFNGFDILSIVLLNRLEIGKGGGELFGKSTSEELEAIDGNVSILEATESIFYCCCTLSSVYCPTPPIEDKKKSFYGKQQKQQAGKKSTRKIRNFKYLFKPVKPKLNKVDAG